jgi:group I intron endonuclease
MTQTVTKRDYSKSIIYKLCCKNPNITEIYVGSTINFKKRKYDHKSVCNNNSETNKKYNLKVYKFIRDNGGFENWDIIMLEEYSCENKKQLEKRERYYIELLKSNLNSEIPTQTKQEYYENNKDKIKEYREENKDKITERKKQYYEDNIDKIKEYQKQYRLDNKDKKLEYNKQYTKENKDKILEQKKQKVNCDICNSIVNRGGLSKHKKTLKCIKFQELIESK